MPPPYTGTIGLGGAAGCDRWPGVVARFGLIGRLGAQILRGWIVGGMASKNSPWRAFQRCSDGKLSRATAGTQFKAHRDLETQAAPPPPNRVGLLACMVIAGATIPPMRTAELADTACVYNAAATLVCEAIIPSSLSSSGRRPGQQAHDHAGTRASTDFRGGLTSQASMSLAAL